MTTDDGTRVLRTAARVVLVDEAGRTLLFRGGDPARPELGSWWFTPGGGVDPGEDLHAAARREVREETGVLVGELGEPVLERVVDWDFDGVRYRQQETFFLVRVAAFEVDESSWTEVERATFDEHRWWSAAELETTDATVFPEELATLVLAAGAS